MLKGKFAGEIKIAASTTIAQYVLPEVVAKFLKSYPDVKITLFNVNSSEVVRMLESGSVDIGMVEGNHKSMNLKYSSFKRDELVVVTSVSSDLYDGNISLDDFVKLPLVLRENGSGTLEILYKELMERGIKVNDLNILAQISTTEGIKNFLYAYKNAYAVLPVSGIVRELKHNMLKIIDVDSLQMNRDFYMVERYGSPKLNILSKFITFCY
jgi:Transcriptional regulator